MGGNLGKNLNPTPTMETNLLRGPDKGKESDKGKSTDISKEDSVMVIAEMKRRLVEEGSSGQIIGLGPINSNMADPDEQGMVNYGLDDNVDTKNEPAVRSGFQARRAQ